jgi:hypothetical protein
MRALTRLTMRRDRTAGALAAAIERIDAIAASTRAGPTDLAPARGEVAVSELSPKQRPVG